MYIVDGFYGAMFVGGMLLCELDLLSRNDDLPLFLTKMKPWKTLIFYILFFISFIFSGVPSHVPDIDYLRKAPGWYYLSFLKPEAVWDQKWFFLLWAAVCFVACVPRIWWLKYFFETSFNQYLGRICFALYLVHGPVLWTLGDRLYVAAGWYKEAHELNIPEWINVFPLSEAGPLGLEPRFLIPHLLILPLTLWLSEIVTKLCDEPIVRFSRWMYDGTLVEAKRPLELHG
jgi:peptidoglycan/LPS O-acetylase OafA/YrhL